MRSRSEIPSVYAPDIARIPARHLVIGIKRPRDKEVTGEVMTHFEIDGIIDEIQHIWDAARGEAPFEKRARIRALAHIREVSERTAYLDDGTRIECDEWGTWRHER